MALTLGQNLRSLRVQRELESSSQLMLRANERLASGQRINRPADDAAGLAIASSLGANARVYTRAILNIGDGLGVLAVADQALAEMTSVTTRLQALAEQAANGVLGRTQRLSISV